MPRLDIIFRDISEEEINKLNEQCKKLGNLKYTEYVRLIISLDAATNIIERLKNQTN